MIGKIIKVHDYTFVYGQDIMYINVFGAFKNTKSGERYIVYSYDDKKIYYGSFFVKDNIGTIMISKNTNKDSVKEFIEDILSERKNKEIEIVDLGNVDSVQVIDEVLYDLDVDVKRLSDMTIPKRIDNDSSNGGNVKNKSIVPLIIILIILVLGIIFIVSTKYISEKREVYVCSKEYNHEELPAGMKEDILLSFNYSNSLTSVEKRLDYIFNDSKYYIDFKNKNYFYKYMDEADSYKFIDEEKTYRLFYSVNVDDFSLSKDEDVLLKYYEDNGYKCSLEEE